MRVCDEIRDWKNRNNHNTYDNYSYNANKTKLFEIANTDENKRKKKRPNSECINHS